MYGAAVELRDRELLDTMRPGHAKLFDEDTMRQQLSSGKVCDAVLSVHRQLIGIDFVNHGLRKATQTDGTVDALTYDLTEGVAKKVHQIDATLTRLVDEDLVAEPKRAWALVVNGSHVPMSPAAHAAIERILGRYELPFRDQYDYPVAVVDIVEFRAISRLVRTGMPLEEILRRWCGSPLRHDGFHRWASQYAPAAHGKDPDAFARFDAACRIVMGRAWDHCDCGSGIRYRDCCG